MPSRSYVAGEVLQYQMTANNAGWQYRIAASDTVKQDTAGIFYDEIAWSDLQSNAPIHLSAESLAFRQTLSLAPNNRYIAVPDLSNLQPALIGPITDLLTFFSDLYLAAQSKLPPIGQPLVVHPAKANSWADGQHTLIGEDSIDFELTIESADRTAHTVTLLVRHIPPKHPQIRLPAIWMQQPVAGAPNNWVQVQRSGTKYTAQIGTELFEDHMVVDARDGRILSATLHNPTVLISRDCDDAALQHCNPAVPQTILRDVSLRLIP